MLIAHVFFSVAPEKRETALNTLIEEAPKVRAMAGCRTFVPFIDPIDPQKLGIIHEWENKDGFAAYIASSGFAKVGHVLRPMMTSAPVSKRFDADLLETVN